MKFRIIFLGLLISGSAALSQALEGSDLNSNFAASGNNMFRSFDNRYEGVHGYPTLLEDFADGWVLMKGGQRVVNQKLNLDVKNGELLVKDKKSKMTMVIRTDMVDAFGMTLEDDREIKFERIVDGTMRFYERVFEGKSSFLFKLYGKYIEKANYGGAYNTTNAKRYDEFLEINRYYYSKDGAKLIEIGRTKKEIMDLFPEKQDILKAYFKKEKPNLKKEQDLKDLFAYLDEH